MGIQEWDGLWDEGWRGIEVLYTKDMIKVNLFSLFLCCLQPFILSTRIIS